MRMSTPLAALFGLAAGAALAFGAAPRAQSLVIGDYGLQVDGDIAWRIDHRSGEVTACQVRRLLDNFQG
ncbi:MAG: hypothetical protein HQL39_17095, partial [Alphaproteobacteria bacterium]|nr:hypothetical protein [Alphaproteobacteria bacterium]